MSALSFREQAAIALYCTPTDDRPNGESYLDAAGRAQTLADMCCAKWGHDWAPMTTYGTWRAHEMAMKDDEPGCRRCGKRPKAEILSTQGMRDQLAHAAGVMAGAGMAVADTNRDVAKRLIDESSNVMRLLHPEEKP